MNGWNPQPLPALTVADFGPTLDHVAEAYLGAKVFAMLHKDDPARKILPLLQFAVDDDCTYVFIHGSDAATRFENNEPPTHEIPVGVAARLLEIAFGAGIQHVPIRLCTCYGNLLRSGDPGTLARQLADELGANCLQAYHGAIGLLSQPPSLVLGASVEWDDQLGLPVAVGPSQDWEVVVP